MNNQIAGLFREEAWSQVIPKEYVIPSRTFQLTQEDVEFLINDDTNPNPAHFSLNNDLSKTIEQMKSSIFAKFANRSAKDCSKLDRKLNSTKDLIMLVKYSEFITEALSQDDNGAELIIRQYRDELEGQMNQFRVYVIDGRVVGICQKNPAFLSEMPTINQIQSAKKVSECIYKLMPKKPKQPQTPIDFTFDLYVSPNGKDSFIIAIEPFYIHFLSLFSEEQLRKHTKEQPLVRVVQNQSQLRQVDLSQYKVGAQLASSSNVHEWIQLMQEKQKQQS